jgi:hypothetical protein
MKQKGTLWSFPEAEDKTDHTDHEIAERHPLPDHQITDTTGKILPVFDFTASAIELPPLSNLLGICHRSLECAWHHQRQLAGHLAYPEVQSMGNQRL